MHAMVMSVSVFKGSTIDVLKRVLLPLLEYAMLHSAHWITIRVGGIYFEFLK